MPPVLYDSRLPRYKTPFGAVPAGQEVTFSIHLPKVSLSKPPELILYQMDEWDFPLAVQMDLAEADAVSTVYRCSVTPQHPALYAYHFNVFTGEETLQIKKGSDGAGYFDRNGSLWQMTVYDGEMTCPPFLREGVIYQIFPDRFYNSGTPKEGVPGDRTLRQDWDGIPVWRPDQNGEVTNSDYFGGDLKGIEEKLEYIASLGVTAIYLNPIFEAHSNHRYNTADYRKVDPLLGTEEDFRRLCERAEERGIRIILDGVFSHTGSDSVYFNREKRYGEGGAFNDPQSPYVKWYKFKEYPHLYDCWWGFLTLPNVEEEDPVYREFICGEDGVLRHWLRLGAAGFRLDVADELPDSFLDALNRSVKEESPGACVIGEVWEDASNKVSYGQRRCYLLGGQLDSVMNYPFRAALLDYIRNGSAEAFGQTVLAILENYPAPAIQCMMNFLSTHDTERAVTALGGEPLGNQDRGWQESRHRLTDQEYRTGCNLFALASILQFGLPGMPCIYYGDEAGLTGYKDPFNRTCYPWGRENGPLLEHIRRLGAVRRDYPIFAEAAFRPLVFAESLCCFVRQLDNRQILFAVNRSAAALTLLLPKGFQNHASLAVWGGWEDGVLQPCSGVVLLAGEGPAPE